MKSRLLILSVVLLMAMMMQAGKPVTVVITAGQSNTAGRCYNDSLPEYIKALNGQYKYCYWSYTNGKTRMADKEGEFRLFWPEMEGRNKGAFRFAYDAITYYLMEQALQKPFYVIKHAEGGTSIDPACRSTGNHHWSANEAFLDSTKSVNQGGLSLLKAFEDNIDKSIDALKAQGLEPDIKCMLWHQGESDRKCPNAYYENLKTMVNHIRQHLVEKTGNKKYAQLPFLCGAVPANSKQYKKQVEDAKLQLAQEDKNFHYIPLEEATFIGDQLHFDRSTAERLGRGMFNKMLDLKLIKGKHAK
ncbi:MAG: polysaccharide deacetylase [Prevotella sp.]|nr:polysaccharide deacetylase [Prevotella sp.]MBQ7427308.1 polysaccharide deacetylase [Prevotella sp.]MBR0263123.1 polysaccharide deacetylase [Prevotella sp.]MBR1411239.1 polysaccharide deacetylase [Prevotella sp.]